MISRMNKEQRAILNELIDAKIQDSIDRDLNSSLRVIEAEEAFEEAFSNESENEDDHNHVE